MILVKEVLDKFKIKLDLSEGASNIQIDVPLEVFEKKFFEDNTYIITGEYPTSWDENITTKIVLLIQPNDEDNHVLIYKEVKDNFTSMEIYNEMGGEYLIS